jgi:ATP-dependent Clp protease, protease subunit
MPIVGINFHGPISHPATAKLRNSLCGAINERTQDGTRRYDEIYLFLNSTGGSVDDGIALFGFLRSLPVALTTINVNLVASITIVPFLAGKTRIALPHSTFHFHDFEWNYGAAHNMTRLEYIDHTQILTSGKETTLRLLEENTSLTKKDFEDLKLLDVPIIKDANFAKEKGIVHEIKYLTLPEDMNIFNVDY